MDNNSTEKGGQDTILNRYLTTKIVKTTKNNSDADNTETAVAADEASEVFIIGQWREVHGGLISDA